MYEEAYEERDRDACKWAMACHLSSLAVWTSFPFANILAPLVVWLIKRHDHPFIDDQGKEAINFQLSVTLYFIAAVVILIVLTMLIIGIFMWWILAVFPFVQSGLAIYAAIKANDGKRFRYPFTLRLIS